MNGKNCNNNQTFIKLLDHTHSLNDWLTHSLTNLYKWLGTFRRRTFMKHNYTTVKALDVNLLEKSVIRLLSVIGFQDAGS